MRTSFPILALTSSLTLTNAARAYSEWLASSFIDRQAPIDAGYGPAVLWEGIARAGAHISPTSPLLKAAEAKVSSLVSADGTLDGWDPEWYSLDDIRIGNNLLYFYQRSGDAKLKTAADGLRQNVKRSQPRTPSGGFWHRAPIYEDQMWLDGIYMADTFNATYFDLIEEHCRNHTSNLLVHGYDEAKEAVWADPVTGASPLVWNRAVGWYFMALIDTLQVYPTDLPGYARLLGYFTRKGNYIEASATAMFAYGLLRGVRDGLLEEKYKAVGLKAYELLVDEFVREDGNGTISFLGTVQVGSLNSNASFEYYTSIPLVENDARGSGAFLFAAIEDELL
uniref:Cell wall glycosyl hydrolase n=1 Tax=Colletotrichum fructicola (strain Nara gc5) TaxID=1213859 RepID=L2GGI9_COLFN